ncbi:MAG: DoxX family protein [Ginsengibacter sp.]
MFQKIMRTGNSPIGFILRLALGIVMLAHGLQQTLGWFGGKGFASKMAYYTGPSYHIPWIFSFLGILTVSIGSVLLIIGLWGRIMAFLEGVFLLVAFFTTHISNGFFMNWEGIKHGEGFEYHILAIGIVIAIIIYGSGWLSLDRLFTKKKERV